MKKKIVITVIIVILLIILGSIFIIIRPNKVTELEKIKLEEYALKSSLYLEELEEDTDSIYKDINYIMFSNLDKSNYVEMSYDEMKNSLYSIFNVSISDEDLEKQSLLLASSDKKISYDMIEKKYYLDLTHLSNQDIAKIPIVKYELKNIKKINNKKFKVEYNRYQFDAPYEILNYYNDNGFDTKIIGDYLSGKNSKTAVKEFLTSDALSNINSKKGKTVVTYIVKDNKLLIDSIE